MQLSFVIQGDKIEISVRNQMMDWQHGVLIPVKEFRMKCLINYLQTGFVSTEAGRSGEIGTGFGA